MKMIILGENPPTKEVVFMKNNQGYAVAIFDAKWDKTVEPYKATDQNPIERGDMLCWLQFMSKEALMGFGKTLIEMGERK